MSTDIARPSKISDATRRCMLTIGESGRAYCGRRRKPETLANAWTRVTCPDCKAAYRADGGRLS